MQTSSNQSLVRLLAASVFATGFSALLYQVAWQRLLGLFSGSDVRSVTIVTSAFLAGLGVGSLLGSQLADRLSNRAAVRAFGLCNVGIGAFAFGSRLFFYDLLFQRLHELSESTIVLLVILFISLLIPTTLMGLSLPLLSRAIVRSTDNAAGLITLMYGVNTLGAGFGTILSGWVLVGEFGYERTIYIGGALSVLVGLSAALAANWLRGESTAETQVHSLLKLRDVPSVVWGWCALVFASGFIAISLEILWFRILDVTLKSNAYTFAHLLSIYLIGDALGSLVGARWVHRIQNPRRTFLWLQGVIALYSLLILWGITLAASRGTPLQTYIEQNENKLILELTGNRLQWAVYFIVPTLMIFPSAFLIGFYYPIVQKAVQTDARVVGQRVGLVEVANIAGNSLAGILTGLVFLEFLGTSDSLRIISILGLLFMAVLMVENWGGFKSVPRFISVGLVVGLIVTALFFPSSRTLWGRLHAIGPDERTYIAEDSTGVAVIRDFGDRGYLYANGQVQGFVPYSETHVLLGILPALVHPEPRNIMIIGIGSSGTPFSAGINPVTEHILAVEIIGPEVDVLRQYDHAPSPVLEQFFSDPRFEIVVGDGRRELFLSDTLYDIIEADAIRPTSSHSGLLYSREYFQAAREHLAEGGIMAQWGATYRVGQTFKEVFPYVVDTGKVLLGSDSIIYYDPEVVWNRIQTEPEINAYITATGVDLTKIQADLAIGFSVWRHHDVRDFPDSDINTDLHPRDEYYLNNE
jgi:spermidine synthase